MCGVVGFIDYTKELSDISLDKLITAILHRGPDGKGKYYKNFNELNIGIGHSRLSILDPTINGKQPMLFDDIVISFNDEIYNFRVLRELLIKNGYDFYTNTDTEVILKSYHLWGINFVNKLNGIFSICIYDKKKKKLYLIRDRIGVKPIYWFFNGLKFIFGSELKIFHSIKNIKKEICNFGLSLYFKYGYIPEPNSILKNISKLEAGSILEFNLEIKELKIKKYWTPKTVSKKDEIKDEREILKNLDQLILNSVELRMIADFPAGIFLSGGIDSSLIASYMSKISPNKINSFTIGFENKVFDEAIYAKKIAKHLGLNHHEFILKDDDVYNILINYEGLYDEPFGDISILPMALLSKKTKKYSKVVLSADGGDELFFGYEKYKKILRRKRKGDLIPKFIKRLKFYNINNKNLKSYFKNNTYSDWLIDESRICDEIVITKLLKKLSISETNFDLNSNLNDSINQMLLLDMKTFLLDDVLWKVDRATMYSGLEARDPLLDYNIVEYSLKISPEIKFKKNSLKYLLKKLAFQKIPESLLNRPKKGFDFSIVGITLKLLSEYGPKLLNEDLINFQNLFVYREVKNLENQIFKKNYKNIGIMWLLLNFQIWYSNYMKI